VHLSGNMLLFLDDGGSAYDAFSGFMSTNLLIRTLEILLFAGLLLHMLFGLVTWLGNRRARPRGYAMNRAGENSTFASRWMFFNGSIIFFFLVVHLYSFWVPARFGAAEPSMYLLVREAFASPLYDAFYLLALVCLGFHLRQGFQSAFQTLGLRPLWLKALDVVAVVFWLLFPVAFAAMPVYFLWTQRL
jgi:succinate dehydrogenase / fumarate reductase cytochrome b subunit